MTLMVGKITVPAGGPVALADQAVVRQALNGSNRAGFQTCHAVLFEALPDNTGKVFFGAAGFSKSTLAGCGYILPPPSATFYPSWGITQESAMNAVDLGAIYLDVETADEGVLVTLQVG